MNDGFARAQADYESRMPPEPVEHECAADVTVTFYLRLGGLTFDTGNENVQIDDWMSDQLMPRLHALIRQEIEQTDPGVRFHKLGAAEDSAPALLRGYWAAVMEENSMFPSGRPADPVVDSDYEVTNASWMG